MEDNLTFNRRNGKNKPHGGSKSLCINQVGCHFNLP